MVDPTDGLEYAIGQGYSALDAQAARSRLDGFAVVTGLTPTAGSSGLEVDIASGDALVGTDANDDPIRVSNSGTTVTLSTADSQYPRKDVVYVDDTGTVQVAEGGADPPLPETATGFDTFQPEPPLVATGTVLAEVFVAAGATTLASGDVRDRRQPAETVASTVRAESVAADSASVTNQVDSGSVNTETLNNGYIYAGGFDDDTPDARLTSALAAASDGEVVLLEAGVTYTTDRTITTQINLIGPLGNFGSEATEVDPTNAWTIDAVGVTFQNILLRSTLQINGNNFRVTNWAVTGGGDINVDAVDCIFTAGKLDGTITFQSGTSGNLVDSMITGTITDNGSNTVGDTA